MSSADWVAPRIDDESFTRLSRLVQRVAGIHLPPPKRALVEARLGRRLRALGIGSYLDYYRHATADESELVQLLDCICTNETRFFREAAHFALLRDRVIPAWRQQADEGRRAKGVKVWSAACSTGEEPYSLAMTLIEAGWDVDVLATDLSTRVLSQAARGEWSLERASQIPPAYLKRFMLRGTGEHAGRMRASDQLRRRIRFQRLNLHEAAPPAGVHDVIFCCNVLIYFAAETRRAILRRLLEHLAADGLLFLGSAEVVDNALPVRKIAPNVYARAIGGDW